VSARVLRYALLAALLAPTAAFAVLPQTTETFGFRRGAFLDRGMGARPGGMGDAFTAVADDASAVSWNPGGTGQLTRLSAVAMHDVAGAGMGLSYLSVALPVGPGVAGVTGSMMSLGSYVRRDSDGMRLGEETARDFAVGASYAVANPRGLPPGSTGVAVEMVSESVGGSLVGISAGGIVPVFNRLTVGWAILHLGPAVQGFTLPGSVKAGVSYLIVPNDFLGRKQAPGAARNAVLLSMDLGYGIADRTPRVGAGLEYAPVPMLVLRAGYRWRGENLDVTGITGLTAGAGFRLGRLGLDYAYQPFGDLAVSHRISLVYGLRLSEEAAVEAEWKERPVGVSTVGLEADAIPDYDDALRFYRDKNYQEALRLAERSVEMDKMYWQAWELAGSCRFNLGDTAGALSAYRTALEVNPQNPQLKAVVAEIESGRAKPGGQSAPGQPGTAVSATPAPAKSPAPQVVAAQPAPTGGSSEADYQASVQLYNARNYDGAWRSAAAALKANPRHWQSWQMIGNCQFAKGDKTGALASYRYALQLNPDNPALKSFVDQLAK
jgi:Tfp pilus assembly protein PilF/opacity protein-like surface antigen